MLAARLPRELFEKFLALQKAPLQRDVDRLKVKYFFDESNFENYYINFKFNQVAVENSERANVVEKHRKHIVEQLLHLRCPQCNVPFGVDFSECMSMACPMCVQNAVQEHALLRLVSRDVCQQRLEPRARSCVHAQRGTWHNLRDAGTIRRWTSQATHRSRASISCRVASRRRSRGVARLLRARAATTRHCVD